MSEQELELDAVDDADALIRWRGGGVRFSEVQALQHIDLVVRRGERVFFVGPNGSGKSTMLRALNGLVPVQGHLQVGDAPVAGRNRNPRSETVRGQSLRSAMLFQKPFLLRLSARRNLMIALWLARVPRREWPARIADVLHRVGLEPQADRTATQLSGGQQQRLALARAWVVRPEVLLLDEPTASLDPQSKQRIEELVLEIAGTGVTVLMTSHNLGQVKRLATRVLMLDAGRVVVDLPADRFFVQTLPTAAAQFLKGELPWH